MLQPQPGGYNRRHAGVSMQGDLWFHLVPRAVAFWVQKCPRAEDRDPRTQPMPYSLVTVMLALQISKSVPTFARAPRRDEKRHWHTSLRMWGGGGSTVALVFLRPGGAETVISPLPVPVTGL